MPCGRADGGFTLIETLIVLAIVAFTMVAAPAMLGTLSGVRLRAAADVMVGILRDTRLQAVRAGQTASVFVDPVQRISVVMPGRVGARWPDVIDAVTIQPPSSPSADGIARIDFFADGTASATRLSLRHGQRSADIKIDRPTGRIGHD